MSSWIVLIVVCCLEELVASLYWHTDDTERFQINGTPFSEKENEGEAAVPVSPGSWCSCLTADSSAMPHACTAMQHKCVFLYMWRKLGWWFMLCGGTYSYKPSKHRSALSKIWFNNGTDVFGRRKWVEMRFFFPVHWSMPFAEACMPAQRYMAQTTLMHNH